MRAWVVKSGLRAPRAVVALALVLMVVGISQLRHAKVDALPEFSPPTVEVQTEAVGLSAAEVEQYITVPLEQNHLNQVPFLQAIRSQSVPGLSSVQMFFEPGTNLFTARQLVQERLSLTHELANVSKPPQMLQSVSSTGRLLMIGMSSQKLSPVELSVLARWTIRPRLLALRGVANVDIWGQQDQQLAVLVDPNKLAARGVTLDQVISTTGNALFVSPLTFLEASTPGSGGFVDTSNQRLGVQHILPIKTPQDLTQVAVVDTNPRLKLGDIATVVQGHPPLIGGAVLKNGPGLLLVIEKLPGANTQDVTHHLDSTLNELRPGLAGVNIDGSIYRPSTFIDTAVHNLSRAGVIALSLVLLALLVILGWRAAVVSAGTAGLAVVTSAYVLYLRGQTINALVFAGLLLAVAVSVHVAIVMSHEVHRGPTEPAPAPENGSAHGMALLRITDAAVHVARPLGYSAAIILLALVPVLFLADLPSRPFLPSIAFSFGLTVAICVVVALVVAPALTAVLLPRNRDLGATASDRFAWMAARPSLLLRQRLGRAYEFVVARLVRRPLLAGLIVLALVVVGAASVTQLSPSLRPSFHETSAVVPWNGLRGTSLEEMGRVMGRAAAELRTVKGVRTVGAHVGRAETADQVVGASSGELWLDFDPKADRGATLAAVTTIVNGYPGFSHQVLSYFNERVNEIVGTTKAPVVVRVYGPDSDVLQSKADEIRNLLLGVRGVVAPHVEQQPTEPSIDISVNLEAAQRNGIKPGDIRRAATTLVNGIEVGSLYQDQKVFQVVVRGTPEISRSLNTVQDMVIDTPAGGRVRLGDVAQIRIIPGLSVIRHEAVSRYLDVTAQTRGRNIDGVLLEVQHRLRSVTFPLGHDARVLGDVKTSGTANRRVAEIGLVLLVFVFLLLQAATRSWRLAVLTFVLLPPAMAGGVAGAWAGGGTLSLGSVAGLVAVGGIVMLSGLALLDRLRRLELDFDQAVEPAAVVLVAREFSRPIVGAALVTATALVPFVALGDVAGTELVRPMGLVVLGGMVTSLLTTLLVLPAWYLRFRRTNRHTVVASAPASVDDDHEPAMEVTGARR